MKEAEDSSCFTKYSIDSSFSEVFPLLGSSLGKSILRNIKTIHLNIGNEETW